MLRHGREGATTRRKRRTTRPRACDTARNAPEAGARLATRPAMPATRPRQSQLGLRQGRPQAAIQPTTRPLGRNARGLCAQPGFRLCTWCTRLSFDSVHSSKSLFMNNVHEHFSRGFKKNNNKKNQIKSNEIKSFKMKFSKIKFCCI